MSEQVITQDEDDSKTLSELFQDRTLRKLGYACVYAIGNGMKGAADLFINFIGAVSLQAQSELVAMADTVKDQSEFATKLEETIHGIETLEV